MKSSIARIVDLSFLQLIFVFLLLVLLDKLDVFSPSINYRVFAYLLPILALPYLISSRSAKSAGISWTLPVLLAAFVFALAVREIPYAGSSVPPGYDPGFYKYTMEVYAGALPQIPEEELADWIREMHPQGLFLLSDAMHIVPGLDSLQMIHYFLIAAGAFLVFPVFMMTRALFGNRAGVLAGVLYAVSYAQFEVFNMCYFKNVLGLLLLLGSLYALEKRKYPLMTITFAGLGIFHRPEFLILAMVLVPYFVLHPRKGIILAAAGSAILVLPFWVTRWEENWPLLTDIAGEAFRNIQTGGGTGGGTFLDFSTYSEVSLAYLPFAFIGAACLVLRREWNSIFFYFLINSVIVIFGLFFYNRLIIPLDIVFIILAALGIERVVLQRENVPRVARAVLVVMVIVSSGIPAIKWAGDTRPLVDEGQLRAIEWIKGNAEDDAFVIATSYDAPWVLGWSGRRVIAPGLFEWDNHDEAEWRDFLVSGDEDVARRFISEYGGPLYIYSSELDSVYMNLVKFENDSFQVVYMQEAVVYKYIEGGEDYDHT